MEQFRKIMGDGFDHFFRKHGPDVMALAFGEPMQVSHAWTAVEFAWRLVCLFEEGAVLMAPRLSFENCKVSWFLTCAVSSWFVCV